MSDLLNTKEYNKCLYQSMLLAKVENASNEGSVPEEQIFSYGTADMIDHYIATMEHIDKIDINAIRQLLKINSIEEENNGTK